MSEPQVDSLVEGRNETPLERCDRNLVELLQEVRVVQTGVQVLFGFLLMAPLSARFPELSPTVRFEYFATMVAAGAAAMLLMSPTAYHRILFRRGDKEHLVSVSNRFTLAGLVCVAVAMLGSLVFVSSMLFPGVPALLTILGAGGSMLWCWCVAPLRRRQALDRMAERRQARAQPLRVARESAPARRRARSASSSRRSPSSA